MVILLADTTWPGCGTPVFGERYRDGPERIIAFSRRYEKDGDTEITLVGFTAVN